MMPLVASIVYCYVGFNTGSPDQQGLHVLECNTETGDARIVQSVKGVQGTTYFQIDKAKKYLYSVAGEKGGDGKTHGFAVRFPISGHSLGAMERLAALPCETPCHVALSPDEGTFSFAAYVSGTAGTFRISDAANGSSPKVMSDVLENKGMGPRTDRQQKAYAHQTFYTPDGSKMGVVDLGTDHIFFYDPATMKRIDSMTITADPGDGPRHAIFDGSGKVLFVVNELGSSVASYRFDGAKFTKAGKWSMLPADCTLKPAETKAAAIKLTGDGRVLMASNRGHDSIAFYDVGEGGMLKLRNVAKLRGRFPRDFELMPGEKFMVVGHKMSDEIQVYAFNRADCTLSPVGDPIPAWRPLCFKFL